MKARPALTWRTCLCVLLLLSGCSDRRAVRPAAVIEVPVPAYRPLDRSLTRPIPAPPAPEQNCSYQGQPAWCVLDVLVWIEAWRGALDRANADRATAAQVSATP